MMNQVQRTYTLAKAYLETLEDAEKEVDRKYIADHHIVNADGTTPPATWAIDDDAIADKAIEETAAIVESSGLWADILAARESLKAAESVLVEYALSIIPQRNAQEKATLAKAVEENYTTRQKVIDLVLKLDTATVKEG